MLKNLSIKKKYRLWLLELGLIFFVLFLVKAWIQREVVSGIAPNIHAVTLKGKVFDLYQTKEKPILVHFWATWCPVCRLEQSSIESISKDYTLLSIAMQSGTNEELNSFMQDENLSFAVVNDEYGLLSKTYRVRGVPASFIINKKNRIKFVDIGYTTELGLRLRLWWAGL